MLKHRLAIIALGLSLSVMSARASEPIDAAGAFAIGVAAFNAQRFEAAVESFQQASSAQPGSAEYLHWLGRAYGRLAERSSWLTAMDLARKTCTAFERAYALDPNDVGTVEDLIEYYTEAPAFLGGGAEKADALRQHLEKLKNSGAQTVSAEVQTPTAPVQAR